MSIERINAWQAIEAFDEIAYRLSQADLSGPIQQTFPTIRTGVRDNFNSSASPDSINWQPRKEIGDGHPLLMESGRMMQAATGEGQGHVRRLFPRMVAWGVDLGYVPYARAQNLGYPPRRLPRREFLGLRESRVAEILAMLGEQCEPIFFND